MRADQGRRNTGAGISDMANGDIVLLAEDNPDDALFIQRAFKKLGIKERLVVVSDGELLKHYLLGQGPYGDREHYPLPKLILLDLGMPRMSGFEVLTWLRQEPALRHLPAVVLTTSTYSPDVRRAYQLGANSFLTKPLELTEFINALRQVADFWLTRCRLPEEGKTRERLKDKVIKLPRRQSKGGGG